jgi:two-component system response regulator AtoC
MMMHVDIAPGQVARLPEITPLALVVVGEGVSGLHRLPASGTATIGRALGATVTIRHPSLSRAHALLRLGRAMTIEDLGSRNGTVLGGRRLLPGETRPIRPGDVVHLGAVCVTLVRT